MYRAEDQKQHALPCLGPGLIFDRSRMSCWATSKAHLDHLLRITFVMLDDKPCLIQKTIASVLSDAIRLPLVPCAACAFWLISGMITTDLLACS